MRRHGNICDTLVFILVAVLLPAWILGHLFLAFFPAPAGSGQTKIAGTKIENPTQSNVSLTAAAKKDGAGQTNALTNAHSSSKRDNSQGIEQSKWQQEAVSLKSSLAGLKSKNLNLSQKAEQLEIQKSELVDEIGSLKNQLTKVSTTSTNQDQQANANRLRAITNDYSQLDEKYQTTLSKNNLLSEKIKRLESRNQQLAMRKRGTADKQAWQQEAEAKAKRLEEQLQKSSIDLAEQRQLVRTMQAEQNNNSGDSRSSIAAREQALQAAAKQTQLLQARVNELTGDLKLSNSNLATRKEELADFQMRFQQLKRSTSFRSNDSSRQNQVTHSRA